MLFWIFLGVVVAASVIAFIVGVSEWGEIIDGVFNGIITFIISGLVSALIMMGVGSWWMKPYVLEEHTDSYDLKALSTSETVEGQFRGNLFVSSGYVEGKQVFTYIQSEGNGFVLRKFDAEDAIVYQGDYDPTIEVTTYRWGNPWFIPWDRGTNQTAEFYVPEGSVANTYEVTP